MADICFVVPIYKVPYDLLQNCINSILGQTHKNIEVILVDDGSPDECGLICDTNAKNDHRIKVVHKKNGGLSEARNTGTNLCESKWITYVDGDDWVDSDFAESFMERIIEQEVLANIYIYNGYRNYATKEIVCTPYYEDGMRFVSYAEREKLQKECCMIPTKNHGNQLFIGSGWAKVFDVDFIRKNNIAFFPIPYGEDSIYFFYSIEMASIVEYVSKPVYHYRETKGGMVNSYRKNADKEQDIYVNELFSFASKYDKSDSFVDDLYMRVFISMQRCVSQKFFNNNNPEGFLSRWRECSLFFSKKPYSDIYKHINSCKLNRNNRFKYYMLKNKIYGIMNLTRVIYNFCQRNNAVSIK
ncbi:hypothetical protein SDC9_16520 [bioreactor metagenome]|uniref:Glycosyltransferase 2-like domain-containing protein n=1 Tax=bioreactor metagenome TaxID=1076179 RepID=A0A644TVV0_9ZZZZ